jgi:SAM-dependent methyltransferase
MPGSNDTGKKEIKEWFDETLPSRPLTVVDFGCGLGTYPKLLGKDGIRWIGVEIWAPYIEQFGLQEWYDLLIIGDLLWVIWPQADCAIFGDVLEHLERDVAVAAMKKADDLYGHAILSVPIYNSQGRTENPYEEHKHWWEWRELQEAVPENFKTRLKVGDHHLVPDVPQQGVFLK